MSTPRVRVLVIDDSAFARKVVREVLSRDPDIEVVGIARDGLEALEKISEYKPDVITLDLVMPDLDGLGVLNALKMIPAPPRVIIVSVSGSDADIAIQALQEGAFDLVTKPTPLPTDRLYEMSRELVEKVKAAAVATDLTERRREKPPVTAALTPEMDVTKPLQARLVVIGTSTGGPQALTQFFKLLPKDFPLPIAVALHIPSGYTAPLAARISQNSFVPMVEAYDGLELTPGTAVIAPGGMHLRIVSDGSNRFFARVSSEPRNTLYHPSVDILFESAAECAGNGALGIVMTGMGSDGTIGAQHIHSAGGSLLTESESSCVVYGMPRSVFESGLSNAEAPLEHLPSLLVREIYQRSRE